MTPLIAPDAPTVALGLNGSAMYLGGGNGSAVGGAVLDTAGVDWLAGATLEFGGDIEHPAEVALDGIDFSTGMA